MPTTRHDRPLNRLGQEPALLSALVAQVTGRPLPRGLKRAPNALRQGKDLTLELVLTDARGRWVAAELQLGIDVAKPRRWALSVALLTDEHERPGDLVVLTHRRSVQRWARRLAWQGPGGSRSELRPIVVLLDEAMARTLLAQADARLVWLAAWAVSHRKGPRAVEVVERALMRCGELGPQALEYRTSIIEVLQPSLVESVRAALQAAARRSVELGKA